VRIAYLLPATGVPVQGPSGSSAHVRGLVRAWRSEEHDVRLYAARISDHRGAYGEPVAAVGTGVPSWPSWLRSWREAREVIAARRVARRVVDDALAGWRPDVIVERHSLFSDAGWRVHSRLGVPWILEVNAPLLEERRRYEEVIQVDWARRWERNVLRAAPTIVTVSRWLQDWLEAEVGCRNVHWVPNGTPPRVGDRARGRALMGAHPREPLVGFVGSMKLWHGIDRLGRIARGVGARLVMVGDNSRAPEDTLLPGHLGPTDLADVIAALDVGLAPYPADAPAYFCPLKILDYRAQGTPVVASDIGEIRALIGGGGSVVPANDERAFVTATQSWLGRRARPRLRSWQRVGREVLSAGLPHLAEVAPPGERPADG